MPLGKRADGRTVGPSSAQRAATSRRIGAMPLRRVVASGIGADPTEPRFDRDVLECGHVLRAAKDLVGRRWPSRRRCHKCAADRPRNLTAEQVQAIEQEG